MMFRDITGQEPPPTLINARSYTKPASPGAISTTTTKAIPRPPP